MDKSKIFFNETSCNLFWKAGSSVSIFSWGRGGGRTGEAPCVQQGDAKPIKVGLIPLVINPILFFLFFKIKAANEEQFNFSENSIYEQKIPYSEVEASFNNSFFGLLFWGGVVLLF